VLVPWLVTQLGANAGKGVHLDWDHPEIAERLAQFYRFTLDVITGSGGATLTALTFMLFVVGPPAIAALPRLAPPKRSGGLALVFVLSAAALYLTLPFSVWGAIEHWWTYPRFGSYVLLGLLLLPAPDLGGRRALALAPGLALFTALSVARVHQFAAYDDRTRPYLRIIDSMEANTSFLPLDYELSWEGTREATLGQLHGYAAAARSAYDPHLFDNPNTPIRYKEGLSIPRIPWLGPGGFTLAKYAPYYDYVLVQGSAHDPFVETPSEAGYRVRLERESGIWRLYAIEKEETGQYRQRP